MGEENMTDEADLVQTVGNDASNIQVTVGGVAVTAAEIDTPEVLVEPDVDCVGEWLPCDVECKSYYQITQAPSGDGEDCPNAWNDEQTCTTQVLDTSTDDCTPTTVEISSAAQIEAIVL